MVWTGGTWQRMMTSRTNRDGPTDPLIPTPISPRSLRLRFHRLAMDSPEPLSQPHSTPHKTSFGSQCAVPESERLQKELKMAMQSEIGNQTYEFPADHIARVLAPKRLKFQATPDIRSGERLTRLDDYDLLIDPVQICGAVVPPSFERPEGNAETDFYRPLTRFLNDCITLCKESMRTSVSAQGARILCPPWSNLWFHTWDRPVKDKVGNAAYLKPDGAGTHSQTEPRKCSWSLPTAAMASKGQAQNELPYEVKDLWSELVAQSGTYTRAMFSANPLRAFSIVIALNHRLNELRFLIFHRGGLTATHALNITRKGDRQLVCMVLCSILSWRSPFDAGLPDFTNGIQVSLECGEGVFRAQIKRVLHSVLCIRGRSTWVADVSTEEPEDKPDEVPVLSTLHRRNPPRSAKQRTRKASRSSEGLSLTSCRGLSISNQLESPSICQGECIDWCVRCLEKSACFSRACPQPHTMRLHGKIVIMRNQRRLIYRGVSNRIFSHACRSLMGD